MTENLVSKETEYLINGWREAIALPVISSEQISLDPKNPKDVDSLEDILRSAVEATGKQALKNNTGKIFLTLSGGVDSSLYLALLAETFPEAKIHTLTVGGSRKHPDAQFGRRVAKMFNTDHHEVIVGEEQKQEITEEFSSFYSDNPQTQLKIAQGDINVWAAYKKLKELGAKTVIAHDGIDELMGGYWKHRETANQGITAQEIVFRQFWGKLPEEHLIPLETTADYFGINILFPYLQIPVVKYISKIPVNIRASFTSGKIPLKAVAKRCVWPREVVDRKKRGFIDALMEE